MGVCRKDMFWLGILLYLLFRAKIFTAYIANSWGQQCREDEVNVRVVLTILLQG